MRSRLVLALLAFSFTLHAFQVRASGQRSELVQVVSRLNDATGPEAYVAVREIWSNWGENDPSAVETALNQIANSESFARGVRDYAGFFAAHARTRRGDVAGAKRRIAGLGYVAQWLVVGPFDNEGKVGLDMEYGPEAQFGEPLVQGRAFSGKERAVRWRSVPQEAAAMGWLNGSSLFRPEQNICFYATTYVSLERPTEATLHLGVRGAYKLFINGELLFTDEAYRGHDVDRSALGVTLPSSTSQLTIKACGTGAAPIVSLRLQASGLNPQPIATTATFGQAVVAGKQPALAQNSSLGVLEQFEAKIAAAATTRSAASRARLLESYARYLVLTDGDDPTVHKARDLARESAELEPTVARLLLAGELSEDHNQYRMWLERAELEAAGEAQYQRSLLLAQAAVARGGLNWRDASPLYERVLRIAPDDLEALQGRVEMLNSVGLERTALVLLESAAVRTPRRVTVLNMLASQLAALGHAVRASEVEQRYAYYRLDDHNHVAGLLHLALARNDRADAEHWVSRLVEYQPDSLWALGQAADAYIQLGQFKRAIAMHRYALKLAPDDIVSLRALSDLYGRQGDRNEQLVLLHRILELRPQAVEVKQYVESIEPEAPRADEAYAWSPDRFLERRGAPAAGENRRTLLDLTVKTVFDNGLSSEFRQLVFQPLTAAAAALTSHQSFRFEADTQRVQLRGARVYRTDDTVDQAIETGVGAANDPSIDMYTSARTYNIRFPRLEAGDVVELLYRIEDVAVRNELDDYFGDVNYFQSGESQGHSEYILLTPKARKFYMDAGHVPGLKNSVKVKGSTRIYRYWADNLPPILPEPAMPPWAESTGALHVSTYKDYGELGAWYWGLIQDQFDLDDQTRALAHELADALPTEEEKVAAVYNWVIKNTRYVALEFGIYGIKPRRCVQTVARGWGDCKDKATVIVSLLRELGIDSTIVLVRTQMRGKFVSKVASLAPFDHAIAYVPSLDLFLDGTAEYTGSRELPGMDQGALALLINRGHPKLVTLPTQSALSNLRKRMVRARLHRDGSAELALKFVTSGVRAASWRRRLNAASSRRERLVSDLSQQFSGFELDAAKSAVTVSVSDFEKPVEVSLSGRAALFARQEGDNLSMRVTTAVRLTEQYASLSKRKLELNLQAFGGVDESYEVEVPPGMKVLRMPTNAYSKTKFGSFLIESSYKNNRVKVRSRLLIDVDRVKPGDYAAWRKFCQAADSAMSARLVVSQ